MDSVVTNPLRFDSLNWGQIERHLLEANEEEERNDPGQNLYCIHCGNAITREDQRIPVQGKHQHVFSNPHGIIFRIGCFATAPGCGQVGTATEEWTWFPGYAWQIALCLGCGSHLGWHYRHRDGNLFYGLILRHLIPERKS